MAPFKMFSGDAASPAAEVDMEAVLGRIDSIVKGTKVVLFMKGSPDAPRCGFSMRAAQILSSFSVEYTAVDVLTDPAIREGIKQYSDWPTIPQVYVNGEFIGGSDILMEMYDAGELEEILK